MKFKKKFSLMLIPGLAVVISALLLTMFSTTMKIANAYSFPFSSPPLSTLQSQLPQQQQHPLDTDGKMITRNLNEQQIMQQPYPFSPQLPSLQLQLQPPQQQNQSTQQPLNANGMSNSHNNNNNKPHNHSPSTVSLLPF
jgi:hypothetical protein